MIIFHYYKALIIIYYRDSTLVAVLRSLAETFKTNTGTGRRHCSA